MAPMDSFREGSASPWANASCRSTREKKKGGKGGGVRGPAQAGRPPSGPPLALADAMSRSWATSAEYLRSSRVSTS